MHEEGNVRGLVEQFQVIRLPVCPRMRSAGTRRYSVEGYCGLDASPIWLMIPSLDIFRNYCTTSRYPMCPWFERTHQEDYPVTLQPAEVSC